MITIKDFMEVCDYRITDGSEYLWNCFGPDSYSLDSWNHKHDGYSAGIVFNSKNQTVYQATVCDLKNNRAYRIINLDYRAAHDAEAASRGVNANQAWDDINYVDLETDQDFLEKAAAIVNNKHYDTRVQVPIELSDSDMLFLMMQAHEADMTFNEYVSVILKQALDSGSLNNLQNEKNQD